MNKSRFRILNFPLSVALLCSSCRDVAKLNILDGLWWFRSFYCGINCKRRSLGRADWSSPGVMLLNCSNLPKGTRERWCLKQPRERAWHVRAGGPMDGLCAELQRVGCWGCDLCRLDKRPHFILLNRDKATAPGMRTSYPRCFPFHIFTCTTEI